MIFIVEVFLVFVPLDYITMEQSGEEMSVVQQHVSLPVNLTQKRHSSDESENIESEEEQKNGELSGEHDKRVDSKMDTSEYKNENHSTNKLTVKRVENLSVSEESDYEEPKNINDTSSPAADGTMPIGAYESQPSVEASEVLSDRLYNAKSVEVDGTEKEEEQECMKCLKCGELINSGEKKINGFSPPPTHFHVNSLRCAHCDSPISDEDCKLNEGKPSCNLHCDNRSSADIPKEEELHVPTVKHEDEKLESESPKSIEKEEEKKESKSNGKELQHEEETLRVDDILPPTGSAKRLVEQWSNIEALKISPSATNVSRQREVYDALFSCIPESLDARSLDLWLDKMRALPLLLWLSINIILQSAQSDSSPMYPPNTAKSIAAKFLAGITEDQQPPKPRQNLDGAKRTSSKSRPSQGSDCKILCHACLDNFSPATLSLIIKLILLKSKYSFAATTFVEQHRHCSAQIQEIAEVIFLGKVAYFS
ncbi:hypothetical protein ACTXT7_006497 [Hymenolepis weldensis]